MHAENPNVDRELIDRTDSPTTFPELGYIADSCADAGIDAAGPRGLPGREEMIARIVAGFASLPKDSPVLSLFDSLMR
jgi:hypothetical protein